MGLGGEAARVREVVGEAVEAEGVGDGVCGVVKEDVAEGGGVGCGSAAVALAWRADGEGRPIGYRAFFSRADPTRHRETFSCGRARSLCVNFSAPY